MRDILREDKYKYEREILIEGKYKYEGEIWSENKYNNEGIGIAWEGGIHGTNSQGIGITVNG